MTTTGATPLEAMRGMITGYEEVEVHEHSEELEEEKKQSFAPPEKRRNDVSGGSSASVDP